VPPAQVGSGQLLKDAHAPASVALVKCNGQDIIKKSTARKNRYLILVNCLLAPAAAGKMVGAATLASLCSAGCCMFL
jgi:hypothetical protein